MFVLKKVSPTQDDIQKLIHQLDQYQIGLYGKLGYKITSPFGGYGENGVSVFMEKVL